MTSLIAGAAWPGLSRAQTIGGQMIPVRGTRLYVEDTGPRDAPALLYLHGGPGAGSFDFSLYQRDRLNKTFRVVIMDQRGVLRSDPVETCTIADLIADCDSLRQALAIDRWGVIGHSFGGMLALRYAAAHPDTVDRVIFENPCVDIRTSSQSILNAFADALDQGGKPEAAANARAIARSDAQPSVLWEKIGPVGGELGEHRDDVYTHRPELHNFFGKMIASSGLPSDNWRRGGHQQALLNADPSLFEDQMPLLGALKQSSVLFKGRFDHVTSVEQIKALAAAPGARPVRVFANSSHFIHVEEPEAYAAAVTDFMKG